LIEGANQAEDSHDDASYRPELTSLHPGTLSGAPDATLRARGTPTTQGRAAESASRWLSARKPVRIARCVPRAGRLSCAIANWAMPVWRRLGAVVRVRSP
jgi:hypothetical protein